MKKRFLSLMLLAVLLISVVPGVHGISPLCFIATNDSVPLVLQRGENPFYSGGRLYIPYNAFDASPNGVGASYNADKNTFVLFNSAQTLIFNLKEKTYTDSQDNSYSVDPVYRSGVLYIPSTVAQHFGLSVTLLFSRYGYPIVRFTDGSQVYDDGTFVAQAENLIDRAAEAYEADSTAQQQNPGTLGDDPANEGEELVNPVNVYLAFVEEAFSKETLDMLSAMAVHGAFFLTEEQILSDRDLVRSIYAAGHTVGLTVSPGETDILSALDRANDALDQVLYFRSAFVLLPTGTSLQSRSFCILPEPAARRVEDVLKEPQTQHLFVVRSGASEILLNFANGGAALQLLRETSF